MSRTKLPIDIPGRRIVRGKTELAKALGVCRSTIQDWSSKGFLSYGTVADVGKIVIYDVDLVLEGLRPDNLYKLNRRKPHYFRGSTRETLQKLN